MDLLEKQQIQLPNLEIEKAMEANGEITAESEMAAHLVDFLYK